MDDRGFILDSHATAKDVYSTLQGSEIRTLLLAPGKKGTPIVCELTVVPAPSSTQFEALSYVWGGTEKTHSISCNGFEFAVTKSLHTALMHLRYPESWRRLWVDQLSINQLENHELMKQVGMMGKLYGSACRVIVWLGKYDQKMSFAFDLVRETSLSSSLVRSDFLHSSPGPSTPRRRSVTPRSTPRSRLSRNSSYASSSRESLHSLSSSTSSLNTISSSSSRPRNKRHDTPPALKHALSIFQHVYFSRKWTFQELILAKAAIICCGDLEMAWSDLSLWYFHYASKLRTSSLLYDSDGSFENVLKVRNELDKGTLTLSNLLMLTRPRTSTKPEDAVYALLGLVPDLVPSLQGNFERAQASHEDYLFSLYLEVFRHCIDKERDLAILSAAGRYKGNLQAENWPGWLPDWRQKLPLRPLVLNDRTDLGPEAAFDEDVFDDLEPASQKADQPQLYKLHFDPTMLPLSSQRLSMVVKGVRLGCIVARPLTWPGCFFVADTLVQSPLTGVHSDGQGDQFSQPLSTLASSFTAFLQRSQKTATASYSAQLIRSSLETNTRCSSVRTSAMVETGDWLCAFNGGRVLFAVRPLQEPINLGSNQNPKQGSRRRGKFPGTSFRGPEPACGNTEQVFKCLFLGECAVHRLNPTEILGTEVDLTEFELT